MGALLPLGLIAAAPVAGLLGAIPTGYALGALLNDVDVRAAGSGNIGATNVNRLLGWRLGALTLGLDAAKGALPAAAGALLWPTLPAGGLLGLLAFAGHCWSPLLDGKGGKGVATAAGVGLVLAPKATLGALLLWALVVGLTRKSSVGAVIAAAALPTLAFAFAEGGRWVALTLALGVLLRHRPNLERLWRGAELGL
jgi:glycerol-3-phosphate acyltransferase PlsY